MTTISPLATVPSTRISNESPSTPDSSLSLLEISQTSENSVGVCPRSRPLSLTRSFDRFFRWTNKTLKITRQFVEEKFGQRHVTKDFQLEEKIQNFFQTKIDFERLWKESRQLLKHFSALLQTQRLFYQTFVELEASNQSSEDLQPEFLRQSQLQKILVENGIHLQNSLGKFVNGLETLISKTMEDTSMTIDHYEKSRIFYDAHRNDYEMVLSRNPTGGISLTEKEELIEREFYFYKQRYEKFQNDLQVKFQLLDQNRVRVMKEQLQSFHQSIINYFSQTHQQIDLIS